MDVNAQIQAFLTSQGFRANDTNKFIATDFTGSSDKSYTIQGEITHELDDILWPAEGDLFPTGKDNTNIFKITDKGIYDWLLYCLEEGLDPIFAEVPIDGAKIKLQGAKKYLEDLLKKMEPSNNKDILADVLTVMGDVAHLNLTTNTHSIEYNLIVEYFNAKSDKFMHLTYPFGLQSSIGPKTEVIKLFKKYIENDKMGDFLITYCMLMSFLKQCMLFGDITTNTLYFVAYNVYDD